MTKNNRAQEAYENETRSPEMELLLASDLGDYRSMRFGIPLLPGSLERELHLLRELLQCFHRYLVPAQALTTIVKSGDGPDAAVRMSGLVLVVGIEKMTPETIVCVRIACRQVICLMASNKGLSNDLRNWRHYSAHTIGHIDKADVTNRVIAIAKDIREDFLTSGGPATGVIHYRVNKRGVLESAEVDFREEATHLTFSEASIPESETRQPECSKAGRKRSPGGSSGRSRRRKPRRWSDLIEMCR